MFWITSNLQRVPLMPQSHPTTGPVRFLSPVRCIARKAEWSTRRTFTPVLSSWSHQITRPVRFDTAVHLRFHRIIRRTPCGPLAMPVWASNGLRTEISQVYHSLRDLYGARAGPTRVPYGHVRELTQPEFVKKKKKKIPCRRRVWPYGPVRHPYGARTGCSGAVYELQTPKAVVSLKCMH